MRETVGTVENVSALVASRGYRQRDSTRPPALQPSSSPPALPPPVLVPAATHAIRDSAVAKWIRPH
jgi:hypothetical protein